MFRNTYQNGLLSIFYSCGANPLAIWDMEVKNGHIKRLTDNEVNSIVLEIVSTNVATTFISCPKNNQVLGIKLPFLVMIVKNLKRYFSFEITILDDRNMRRRFRISNFQSTTKIKPFCTSMPIGLSGGWNQIQFNLSDFTRRAYASQYVETLRVQVHANARVRRIYFSERLYTEEELPQEYKLYLPLERKMKKGKEKKDVISQKEEAKPPVAAEEAPPQPDTEVQAKLSRKSKLGGSSKKIESLAEEEKPSEVEAAAGEEPGEAEKEAAEPAAEGITPAESEAPVESEAPAEVEAPAEGEPTAMDEAPAAGETPAADAAPPADEAPPPADEAPAPSEEPEAPTESAPAEAEVAE